VPLERHLVGAALDIAQAHACAKAHLADPLGGSGVAGLHRLIDIGDAGPLIADIDADRVSAHLGADRAARGGVQDEVHLGLVGGDGDAPQDGGMDTQVL